jgi:hypothetical protein
MATVRRRRRQIDADIERAIILLADNHTPTQIHRELERRLGKEHVPALRTVQRVMADVTPKDAAPWQLAEADPDDAAVILPVLGAVIERTEGQVRQVTRGHAEWIGRLRRADPTLPAWTAFALARIYVAQVDRGQSTAPFDELMALAPWGNPQRYQTATRRGWTAVLSPRLQQDLGLLEGLEKHG